MMKKGAMMTVGAVVFLTACAQKEEPAMVIAEPVFDKYGNAIPSSTTAAGVVMIDTDGDGVVDTPVTTDPEVVDPNGNRNRNQNENQNRSTGG